jgi:tRNA (guanosine-2'-O-)-methyltransferase
LRVISKGQAGLVKFKAELEMITKQRQQRIQEVLKRRQPDLRVVLEDIRNSHNASAVIRTCDAAGVMYMDIIRSSFEPFPVNEAISTRVEKWLRFSYFSSPGTCISFLKKKGFTVAATHLSPSSTDYAEFDYKRPVALVFGNEAEGISDETLKLADTAIKIPMFGMAQSLNLSVSAGVILYEAVRQRRRAGYLFSKSLSGKEIKQIQKQWQLDEWIRRRDRQKKRTGD